MKKGCYIIVGLIFLLGLLGIVTPATTVSGNSNIVKWHRVSIPTEGKPGNWVLAKGSDVQHLTQAVDGTLYCYANPSGTSYTLFKSTDEGKSWSYTGKVTDTIIGIACSPDDADVLYYATTKKAFKSENAGGKFDDVLSLDLPTSEDITSIDCALLHDDHVVVVGTKTDNQGGHIYVFDEGVRITPGWRGTNLTGYDVYALACSPNFATDQQLVAVVTDETNTLVTTRIGSADWGATVGNARLDKDNSGTPTPIAVDTSADIGFPSDYNSDAATGAYVQFIAIDAGSDNGDVYRIDGAEAPDSSVATDLNIGSAYELSNIDVTGLAVTGDASTANLLAGAAGSAQVYFSTDGGTTWSRSKKQPTGQSKTYVLVAPDFNSSGRAYTATSGSESAFSCTADGGVTWNQLGLIDTGITDIVDLALSPNYAQDDTLFMLTYGSEHSLWRSSNDGKSWQRVLTSTAADVDTIDLVELSPRYGNGSQVVFIAGTSNSNPAIWKSTDNGQRFSPPRTTRDPAAGITFTIDTWAVVNDNTLFVGSYDDSNGLVYRTTNSGLSYSTKVIAGGHSLNSITLSPGYEQDETILVGNTDGWVYWSDNNGSSFEPLPRDASSAPLTDKTTVAFDPKFSRNRTVYAASDTADKGVHRFIIGTSTSWESIDGTLPSGGMVSKLMVSADGILYATNFKADGGLERCLNPTYSLGPTFETVTRGLDDGATLSGLWLHDNRLWSMDTTNTRLMTFIDSFNLPVTPTLPSNQAAGVGTIINYTISNASLDWETLKGATSYKWQLDHDTDFSSVPSGFEGNTRASSARLPTLEPFTTYYWRVRATEPVLSPWSAKWSFTTSIGTETIAPKLVSPEAGAGAVSIRPIFQWSAVAGGDSYELVVSTDASLDNPTILKVGTYALPTTAWQCNIALDYDTTYYWKVRAISPNASSEWSEVGAFTIESPSPPPKETPAPVPPPPSPPPPPAQPTTPDWIIYLVGPLTLTITLLIITILVLALRRR